MIRRSDDDVAILLHATLVGCEKNGAKSGVVCKKLQQRLQQEQDLAKIIDPFWSDTDQVGHMVDESIKMFGQEKKNDDENLFKTELVMTCNVNEMSAEVRKEICPALWSYRRPFSLEDFTMES
eukprot:TRINITY_DN4461_c0_g1_i1.p1 TRINITY_DN4461_c0_g1~~TRINITY_DN4461_c0_g1_i1.p1  ORF type:complete len:123 (-),score=24.33 TRINITY_DN4461_c0_g1_i1:52-420(-)